MKKILLLVSVAAGLLAFSASAGDIKASDAVIRLLNARGSVNPKAYLEAAEDIAREAEEGVVISRYVAAVVSRDRGYPEKHRPSFDERRKALDKTRGAVRRLAEQDGDPIGWYLLSLENNDKACLRRAAESGNIQAMNAWGTAVINEALSKHVADTNALDKALLQGFGYFKKASEQGDANGYYNLGMCYLNGFGCAPDADHAFLSFRTAAEAGHPEAINNLGGFFRDGIVVRKNPEMATRWFERSARLGNAYGQLNYALALQRGDGLAKDEEKAVEYFKLSAMQGAPEAMDAYGMCFYHGTGVAKDFIIAVEWFRAAAARGFAPAMENLSHCYHLGQGVMKDEKMSLVWKARAMAARGDANAASWLKQNGYSENK